MPATSDMVATPNAKGNRHTLVPMDVFSRSADATFGIQLKRNMLAAGVLAVYHLMLAVIALVTEYSGELLGGVHIAVPALSGNIINVGNLGAAIGVLTVMLLGFSDPVIQGLAKAWTLRVALTGRGASVRHWNVAAAGQFGILQLLKYPTYMYGLGACTWAATALVGAVSAGILLPTLRYVTVPTVMLADVTLLSLAQATGNISCVDTDGYCLAGRFSGEVTAGLMGLNGIETYHVNGYTVGAYGGGSTFTRATYPGDTSREGDITYVNEVTILHKYGLATEVIVSCQPIEVVEEDEHVLHYNSSCMHNATVSKSAATIGTSYAQVTDCLDPSDSSGYYIEYMSKQVGAMKDSGSVWSGFSCLIQASEGMSSIDMDRRWNSIQVHTLSSAEDLPGTVVRMLAGPLLSSLKMDAGIPGRQGQIDRRLRVSNNGTGPIGAWVQENIRAAMGVAVSGAYYELTNEWGYGGDLPSWIPVRLSPWDTYGEVEKYCYGWGPGRRLTGWGIISAILSLVWLLDLCILIPGGSRYDPSDWFSTVNLTAGSRMTQIPGTCTGGNFLGRKHENIKLWLGEIGPHHAGLSYRPASIDERDAKLGSEQSNCVQLYVAGERALTINKGKLLRSLLNIGQGLCRTSATQVTLKVQPGVHADISVGGLATQEASWLIAWHLGIGIHIANQAIRADVQRAYSVLRTVRDSTWQKDPNVTERHLTIIRKHLPKQITSHLVMERLKAIARRHRREATMEICKDELDTLQESAPGPFSSEDMDDIIRVVQAAEETTVDRSDDCLICTWPDDDYIEANSLCRPFSY